MLPVVLCVQCVLECGPEHYSTSFSAHSTMAAGPADGRFWVGVRQDRSGAWGRDDADKLSAATSEERYRDKLGLSCVSLPRPTVLLQSAVRLVGNCPLDESAFEGGIQVVCPKRRTM